jgi:hypothetical protein
MCQKETSVEAEAISAGFIRIRPLLDRQDAASDRADGVVPLRQIGQFWGFAAARAKAVTPSL